MSTRAVIARSTDLGWRGKYHHSDGYPMGLGRYLFQTYQNEFKDDLAAMQKILLDDHPAGWSNIIGSNLRHTSPGFDEGRWAETGMYIRDASGNLIDNPDYDHARPQCYCHGDRAEEEHTISCQCVTGTYNDGALFIEYAYVLCEMGMEVWYSVRVPGQYDPPMTSDYQAPTYKHELYRLIPWTEQMKAADWEAMEAEISAAKQRAWDEDELLATKAP